MSSACRWRALGQAFLQRGGEEGDHAAARTASIAVAVIQWSDESNQLVDRALDGSSPPTPRPRRWAMFSRRCRAGWPKAAPRSACALAISPARMLAEAPPSERRVIDISSDGRNNIGPPVNLVRDRIVAQGHHHQRAHHPQRMADARQIFRAQCGRRAGALRHSGQRLCRLCRGDLSASSCARSSVPEFPDAVRRRRQKSIASANGDSSSTALAEAHRGPESRCRPLRAPPCQASGERNTYLQPAGLAAGRRDGHEDRDRVSRQSPEALPAMQALYPLFDGENGTPLAVIDGTALTYRKTAADSALGSKLLSRPDAANAADGRGGGAGALSDRRPSRGAPVASSRVLVWNRDPTKAEALAAACGGEAVATISKTAVRAADIVCCATASTRAAGQGRLAEARRPSRSRRRLHARDARMRRRSGADARGSSSIAAGSPSTSRVTSAIPCAAA